MNTRLHIKHRAGGSRLHPQQFDYSTSSTDDELTEAMLPIPTYPQDLEQPEMPPEPTPEPAALDPYSDFYFQNCLSQLFSDHEPARSPSPQLTISDNPPVQSLAGTSSSLLTKPSLTDYLSNYPFSPHQAEDSDVSVARSSSPSLDDASQFAPKLPTAPSFKRGRGRSRKKLRVLRQTKTPARNMVVPARTETQTGSLDRYQLWQKLQHRYRCGTCGVLNCVCILAVNKNREVSIGAREFPGRTTRR